MKRNTVRKNTNVFFSQNEKFLGLLLDFFTPLKKALYKHLAYDGFYTVLY